MVKVRTTQRPWLELDVDPAEYTDLSRQGLLAGTSLPKQPPQGGTLPVDVDQSTKGN